MGQSTSHRRPCHGHHHHQYQYNYSFPPPPPPFPPPHQLMFFPTEPYPTHGPWDPPSTTSSPEEIGGDENPKATRIRNVVNVHRDSIRVEADDLNPGHSLVSFVFDAVVNGSFTIFYFAKEGPNCSFSLMYPEIYMPLTVPFQKGAGQKFRQPSGSGINLSFFGPDKLSTPLHGDIFPLVIYAGASSSAEEPAGESTSRSCAQITQAVIKDFKVKVAKQILWLNGNRYELQEIFEADFDDGDGSVEKECVICVSEPIDTAVLPCRHMCMCIGCAKELRLQSNKCPICRQPIEKLMEIEN